jgi:hypothetical protein
MEAGRKTVLWVGFVSIRPRNLQAESGTTTW